MIRIRLVEWFPVTGHRREHQFVAKASIDEHNDHGQPIDPTTDNDRLEGILILLECHLITVSRPLLSG